MSEPQISVIVPVRDEKDNLAPLLAELLEVLGGLQRACEVILVDDGCRDGSAEVMDKLAASDPRVLALHFDRHYGQSAALLCGLRHARGEAIVILDADRQADPRDIPKLLELLPGHGAVTGIRTHRHDSWWRRITSRFANRVRNFLTREGIVDTGCPIKVFAAAALRDLPAFDGMHRFLPTLVRLAGHAVVQTDVRHRRRLAGRSKYGTWDRAFRGLRDALGVRWLQDRHVRWQLQRKP